MTRINIDRDQLERFELHLHHPQFYSPVEYLIIWAFASRPHFYFNASELVELLGYSAIQVDVKTVERALARLSEMRIFTVNGQHYQIGENPPSPEGFTK